MLVLDRGVHLEFEIVCTSPSEPEWDFQGALVTLDIRMYMAALRFLDSLQSHLKEMRAYSCYMLELALVEYYTIDPYLPDLDILASDAIPSAAYGMSKKRRK